MYISFDNHSLAPKLSKLERYSNDLALLESSFLVKIV